MKRRNAFLNKNFFSILILFIISLPVKAQYQDSITQNKKAIDSTLINEHLDSLNGLPKTFYTDGYRIRATALQKLIKVCIDFYQSKFSAHQFNVPLYVLDSNDWKEQLFAVPYALPDYLPENNIIIIGAEKNALAKLSGQPQTTTSESIVSGYDYVAVHELGHYFFITLNNTRTHQKWFDEFVANYFLVAFMIEKKPDVTIEWNKMIEDNDKDIPEHRTLEDFEKFYDQVGPPNYDWYQKKFMKLCFLLYPQFKTKLITDIVENYASGGKNIDALTLMKSIASETMNKWLKEMQ
ncbi:MAG: hypothetical protein ACR2FN_12875 [Chitinophagaceae bacterium]